MSLLSIESVHKSYFHKPVLKDINLKIHSGDRIGLIGENGAGKTTLFRMITKAESPDTGKIILSGNAIIGYLTQELDDSFEPGQDALSNKELLHLESAMRETELDISVFSGDHESSAYKKLAERYTMLHARFEALDGYAYERNMREILSGLDLREDILSLPFTSLSGGEKMRVALARILLRKPDLLLLDEPTNHLDIRAIEWLESELQKYHGGLIAISHDRYFLDRVTTRTASLENCKLVVRSGNYSSFILQAQTEIEHSLKEQKLLQKKIEQQTQIKQTMLSHRNMSGYHQREKMLSKLSDTLSATKALARTKQCSRLKVSFLKGNAQKNSHKVLLQAIELSKSFDDRLLFSDVSFELIAGEKVFLTGPNGCGKSTLFSLFLGETQDFNGTVKLAPNLTYLHMGQYVQFETEEHTLIEELIKKFEFSVGQATEVLAHYGFFGTDLSKKINILSGGERSRLFLACTLHKNPDILFLDEPTNHLDIPSREVFERVLKDFKGAFIAISHDRYFIEKCGGKILGFLNQTVQPFESYEIYRQVSSEIIPRKDNPKSIPKHENIDLRERKNRAEERRLVAKTKEDLKTLEEEIALLEEEREALEQSFTATPNHEQYIRYAKVLEELERFYKIYVEKGDRFE